MFLSSLFFSSLKFFFLNCHVIYFCVVFITPCSCIYQLNFFFFFCFLGFGYLGVIMEKKLS